MENAQKDVRDAFFIVATTLLLFIVVYGLWSDPQSKLKILILESLTLVPVLIYMFLQKIPFRKIFRWKHVDPKLLLVSAVIGLGFCVVVDEIDVLIQSFFPMSEDLVVAMDRLITFNSPGDLIVLILGVVVIAAFGEEMLFRGFFQGVMEKATDVTKAVITTAFVFAFIHFNPWWLVEILILGVFLGVMAWRSGSIFPCIVVHGLNNGFAILFTNVDPSRLGWYQFRGHVAPVWILLGIGCLVYGFRLFYRLTEDNVVTE